MKEESNGSVLVIIAIWFIYVGAEAAWVGATADPANPELKIELFTLRGRFQ